MWEDKPNISGGRFLMRVKIEYSNKIWEDLILSFIGKNTSKFINLYLGDECKETSNICGL